MKLVALLACLFVCNLAWSFTLNNSIHMKFSQDNVVVNIANNCNNLPFSSEELLHITKDAISDFWNKVPTSRLSLHIGSTKNVTSNFYNSQLCQSNVGSCEPNPQLKVENGILISCNVNSQNFPHPGILGITVPNNFNGSNIIGSLILLNDSSSSSMRTKNYQELVSIISHEIGHAIGLGHSSVEDSLMFFSTMDKRTALGQDDMDGVTYLYPKEQPIALCGSIDTSKNAHPNFWGGLFIGFLFTLSISRIYKKYKS